MSVAASPARRGPQRSAGPLARLEPLCDPGSLELIRTGVVCDPIGDRARPGDGVLAGAGRVGGRPGLLLRAGPRASSAAASARPTRTRSCGCMELAERAGAPVVGFVESGGARLQEGHAALGRLRANLPPQRRALARRSPQISVVSGVSAGGGAYSPALTDFVVMTPRRPDVPDRPRVVQRGAGRGGDDGGARRRPRAGAATASPSSHVGIDERRLRRWFASCSASCPARSASRRRWRPRQPPPGDPGGIGPRRAAAGLRRPRRGPATLDDGDACSRSRRAGRRTWSPRLAASRAGRSG